MSWVGGWGGGGGREGKGRRAVIQLPPFVYNYGRCAGDGSATDVNSQPSMGQWSNDPG